MAEVARLLHRSLERGSGLIACLIDIDGDGHVVLQNVVPFGFPDSTEVRHRASQLTTEVARLELAQDEVARVLERVNTLSEVHPLCLELSEWRALGVTDALFFRIPVPQSSRQVIVVVPSIGAYPLPRPKKAELELQVSRLRSALSLDLLVPEHSPDPLLCRLRAQSSGSSEVPAAARGLLKGLVNGELTCFAHRATGNSRVILARRNRTEAIASAALTDRERRIALLLVQGQSAKYIAYEHGIALSTASNLIASAIRKLGLRSRIELVEVYSLVSEMLESPPRVPEIRASARHFEVAGEVYVLFEVALRRLEPPESLTSAQREVVRGVLEQMSNAEIARARRTSINTVANQLHAVYQKLGISGRSQLLTVC